MAAPWTQVLSLRWRPALTFYANRVAILEEFDRLKVLQAFRVGDDQVDARLLAGHELAIGHNRLSLEIFRQDADLDEVWALVSTAYEKIAPKQIGGVHAQFQHIVPLDIPYAEALRTARDVFLAPVAGEDIKDFALLVNLAAGSDATPANFGPSVEFGIINAQEARMRLTRSAGRMRSHSSASQLPPAATRWKDVEFPPTALFADSNWPQADDAEFDKLDDVRTYLDTARERASEFVDCLYEKITIDQQIGGNVEP